MNGGVILQLLLLLNVLLPYSASIVLLVVTYSPVSFLSVAMGNMLFKFSQF